MSRIRAILNSLTPERIKSIRIITLSIIVAGTFWFLNALNGSYSTTFRYPIKFVYDKDKYIAIKAIPEDVLVNVTGVGWNLFRVNLGINTSPIIFKLESPADVKKLPGTTLLGTITDQLDEFNVNFVLTDTVYLRIDKKIQKKYALQVDSLTIDLEDNYWITTPIMYQPDSVNLVGPETILNLFEDVILVKLPQQKIDDNYNEEIPIEVVNNNLISRDPPTIQIRFEVEEYSRNHYNVPIKLLNFPADSSAILASGNALLTFDIGQSKKDQLSEDLFEVTADFKKFIKKDSTISLKLKNCPDFIRNVTVENDTLKVVFP